MIGHAHVHASELGTGRRLRMIRECSEVLTQPVRCRAVPPTPAWRMICRDYRSRVSGTITALKPYEKFAEMIDRHWDGIAAYCRLENKVSLGFVEGLNNKIRVIQRRAYGLRNEEYLRLKILTCMLPAL